MDSRLICLILVSLVSVATSCDQTLALSCFLEVRTSEIARILGAVDEKGLDPLCSSVRNKTESCLQNAGCLNSRPDQDLWDGLKDAVSYICIGNKQSFEKHAQCVGSTATIENITQCEDTYKTGTDSQQICTQANQELSCVYIVITETCQKEAGQIYATFSQKFFQPILSKSFQCKLNSDFSTSAALCIGKEMKPLLLLAAALTAFIGRKGLF